MILKDWIEDHIGIHVNEIIPIDNNGKVFLILTNNNEKYYVKKKRNVKQIQEELSIVIHLNDKGLPTTIPIQAKNGEVYFKYDNDFYWIYKTIEGSSKKVNFEGDYLKLAKVYGNLMAQLHLALKDLNYVDGYEKIDVKKELEGWIIKTINEKYEGDTAFLNEVFKKVMKNVNRYSNHLPCQFIHRDFHAGNVLFKEDKMVGILDLEFARYGPRIFEPCYFCTGILSEITEDEKKKELWFKVLESVFKGYNNVTPLDTVEKDMILHILYKIQLLFIAYWAGQNNKELADLNEGMLKWLYNNEEKILNIVNNI